MRIVRTCYVCGAFGHNGKQCPLFRLNERQTAFSSSASPKAIIKPAMVLGRERKRMASSIPRLHLVSAR